MIWCFLHLEWLNMRKSERAFYFTTTAMTWRDWTLVGHQQEDLLCFFIMMVSIFSIESWFSSRVDDKGGSTPKAFVSWIDVGILWREPNTKRHITYCYHHTPLFIRSNPYSSSRIDHHENAALPSPPAHPSIRWPTYSLCCSAVIYV